MEVAVTAVEGTWNFPAVTNGSFYGIGFPHFISPSPRNRRLEEAAIFVYQWVRKVFFLLIIYVCLCLCVYVYYATDFLTAFHWILRVNFAQYCSNKRQYGTEIRRQVFQEVNQLHNNMLVCRNSYLICRTEDVFQTVSSAFLLIYSTFLLLLVVLLPNRVRG